MLVIFNVNSGLYEVFCLEAMEVVYEGTKTECNDYVEKGGQL